MMLYQPEVREDLQYAEDIFEELGEPLLHKMAIFEAVLIGNEPRTFEKTVKMSTEGVYSTYFIFAPVKKVEAKITLDTTADEEDGDALVNYFGSFFGNDRLLRASN